jgi:hypothetical protein
MVVDSVPVPVIKMAKDRIYRTVRKNFEKAQNKGYSAINRGWYIAYKLHVVIFDYYVIKQSAITKSNIHDINHLKSVNHVPSGKQLLGDGAYRSNPLQIDLFRKI